MQKTTMLALLAAHFEDVREVRSEFEPKAHFHRRQREVPNSKRHVHPVLPQEPGTLHTYRTQFLWQGRLQMALRVRNFALTPVEMSFGLEFGADFADIFEVRGEKREHRRLLPEPQLDTRSGKVVLEYEGLAGVVRRTIVGSSPQLKVQVTLPSALHFSLRLSAGEEHPFEFTFAFEMGNQALIIPGFTDSLESAAKSITGTDR